MKKLTALAVVALASQAVITFAGEPVVSSKQVITPAPPPVSYFRPNEFDIGAFATYATGTGENPTGTRVRDGFTTTVSGETTVSGWGGGMDFSYFFPWKYAGVRFQGAGVSLSTGDFTVTETFTGVNGVRTASRTGSVSTAAGVITAQIILRLPLDDYWPSVHLAPYGIGGFGCLFAGGGGQTINTQFPELNARVNSIDRSVQSRPLGTIGGGFEYRFTPHIGLFGEATYNFIDHIHGKADNNFIQTNFGLRYAF
jgi:hypothetical protein